MGVKATKYQTSTKIKIHAKKMRSYNKAIIKESMKKILPHCSQLVSLMKYLCNHPREVATHHQCDVACC